MSLNELKMYKIAMWDHGTTLMYVVVVVVEQLRVARILFSKQIPPNPCIRMSMISFQSIIRVNKQKIQ